MFTIPVKVFLFSLQLFVTLVAVVTFFLPAVIIATCYIAIILVIWTKGQNSRDSSVERSVLNGRQSEWYPFCVIAVFINRVSVRENMLRSRVQVYVEHNFVQDCDADTHANVAEVIARCIVDYISSTF